MNWQGMRFVIFLASSGTPLPASSSLLLARTASALWPGIVHVWSDWWCLWWSLEGWQTLTCLVHSPLFSHLDQFFLFLALFSADARQSDVWGLMDHTVNMLSWVWNGAMLGFSLESHAHIAVVFWVRAHISGTSDGYDQFSNLWFENG